MRVSLIKKKKYRITVLEDYMYENKIKRKNS
jgi:hypothetical protein